MYLYLGAGVGAGLFLSGRLHPGATGIAGELAFVRLDDGQTLMHRLGQSVIGSDDGRSVDVERAQELVDKGADDAALKATLDVLGRMIINMITVIDPGQVVLGGPLAQICWIATDLSARLGTGLTSPATVMVSALGHDAPLAGAAIGALELARSRQIRPRMTARPRSTSVSITHHRARWPAGGGGGSAQGTNRGDSARWRP